MDMFDRRGMLRCMGWAGTGALFTLGGGIPGSITLDAALGATPKPGFSFLQISDTHLGFNKPANPDPLGTLKEVIAKAKALPVRPDFIIHTGDVTHLATPEQFDLAQQMLGEFGVPIHVVPGEHDIVDGNDPRPFLDRFGRAARGEGWYSFDAGGAHFVALVNSIHLGDRGMGTLGEAQLAWLGQDLAGRSASTPIIVFAHFPLWDLYSDWGWGTADGAQALSLLKRFGSVTVLNGHIHQVQQKIEGDLTFHTARSTAYPQPAPGEGAGPGPLVLPSVQLRSAIGLRSVTLRQGAGPIAITDTPLA
ncbi:putative hydrolase [Sphingomonas changbaiensis NBRC 104936]|uniref:Putative hydrolase n=1 Tax=Sphingomonas changbaiensis NBRC 104936 TaxID=1219043 RepID=A0A0E9MNS3_9SPHN|nr:metallophosphoesterase [Sphingomonas changbaiensis]GAO39199.1 putative hydrolase [Sphingomonas changbaiensis NBRC 104936]